MDPNPLPKTRGQTRNPSFSPWSPYLFPIHDLSKAEEGFDLKWLWCWTCIESHVRDSFFLRLKHHTGNVSLPQRRLIPSIVVLWRGLTSTFQSKWWSLNGPVISLLGIWSPLVNLLGITLTQLWGMFSSDRVPLVSWSRSLFDRDPKGEQGPITSLSGLMTIQASNLTAWPPMHGPFWGHVSFLLIASSLILKGKKISNNFPNSILHIIFQILIFQIISTLQFIIFSIFFRFQESILIKFCCHFSFWQAIFTFPLIFKML